MDNKETWIKYAPLIIVVCTFLWSYNIFVRPEAVEEMHREILAEIDNKYATKETAATLQNQYDKLSEKLDRVLYILTDGKQHYDKL